MTRHSTDITIIKSQAATGIKYIFLILYSLTTIYPFIWVIFNSFKDNDQIYGNPFGLPSNWRFDNYVEAWVSADIGRNFLNSLIYSFGTVAVVVMLAAMTAYVLARIWTVKSLYLYFTIGIMIPVHAVIIPLFVSVKTLGLMNTRWGLLLIYIVGNLSFSIFVLVGFMKGFPRDIEEAALIDGCNTRQTFFKIVLPVIKPGIATVGTFAFLNCWNDFLLALLFAVSPNLKTLNLACFNLRGQYITRQGLLCAGLVLLIIPVTIIYITFQEQVIKGMTAGAVKG